MDLNVLCKWHLGMLDQQTLENRNVPPQFPSKSNYKGPWVNRVVSINNKGKWIDQALEETMATIEKCTCTLRVASMSWDIPMTSFLNHLFRKTKSWKYGPLGNLIDEEDAILGAWILVMQECGLLITLKHLKLKVVELMQTRPTPILEWCTKE
jgi:hypothetical protein